MPALILRLRKEALTALANPKSRQSYRALCERFLAQHGRDDE